MRKFTRHLTYANVMASLAVFLVLGGAGAIAAKKNTQKVGASQLKASAVTTAKIKNGAVQSSKLAGLSVSTDKLAEGSVTGGKLADGSVTNAKLGPDAVSGDKVNEATLSEVPSANSANPSVFARVNANATVDAGNSKGITSPNVTHPFTGVYCISVSSFTPRGGQVTPQAAATSTTAQIAIGGGEKCSGGAVQVSIWSSGAAPTATDAVFFVEVYR